MKKTTIILLAILTGMAGSFQSCDLKEYNPSGTTADVIFATPEGIETVVNAAYYNFRWKFFGREDPVLYLDGGTDIWINAELSTYGRQLTKYDGLVSTTGQIANVWNRLYDNINLCNAAINRIPDVVYQNPDEKKYREGEVRFIRAFSYWWLVEFFGDIDMRTTETKSVELEVHRTPAKTIYDEVIIPDLQKACELLLPEPIDGLKGRVTLKAAYGMLARAALTRAAYGEKDQYNQMALDAAKYVIDNKSTLKVDLYSNYADIFKPANNKDNMEAMFVVTHSTNASLNPNPNNANRLFAYYNPRYINFVGCTVSYADGPDNQGPRLMPTKYLLQLYDEYDARYAASFKEVFKCNSPAGYTWTAAHQQTFKKPAGFVNTVRVENGDTALYYTRRSISQTQKDTARYAIVDINMVYDAVTGEVKSTTDQFARFFPKLNKFIDPDRPTENSQAGTKDVIIMRMAEMYLIAAEAQIALGHPDLAVPYIQTLRQRATVAGHESAMAVTASDMTADFILEERARELCGEAIRWFDLKRTGKLYSNVKAHNKNITLIQEFHKLRPIPETFLNTITDREEFGQNFGYTTP